MLASLVKNRRFGTAGPIPAHEWGSAVAVVRRQWALQSGRVIQRVGTCILPCPLLLQNQYPAEAQRGKGNRHWWAPCNMRPQT